MSVTSAFTSAILPIIAIAAVGYVIGRRTGIRIEPLNTVALQFLLPALVFHGIATTSLSGDTAVVFVLAVAVYLLVMMVIAFVGARAVGLPDDLRSGAMLASAFPNSGFVGIPLTGFLFGDFGRTVATIFLTTQSVLLYTLGVYVVSADSDDTGGAASAVREVFRLPLVYAVALAILLRLLHAVPPIDGTLMTTVDMVGSAAIPLMLTVVGIQLAKVDLGALRGTALPTATKLVLAPLVGAAIALVVGFTDPRISNTFVLECATPAAVTPLAIVIAYSDVSADDVSTVDYMSTVIFLTTVLSVVTLTALVVAIQAGLLF